MVYRKVAMVSVPEQSMIIVCNKFGHEYKTATVDTVDGHIVTYYEGRSKRTALEHVSMILARTMLED